MVNKGFDCNKKQNKDKQQQKSTIRLWQWQIVAFGDYGGGGVDDDDDGGGGGRVAQCWFVSYLWLASGCVYRVRVQSE